MTSQSKGASPRPAGVVGWSITHSLSPHIYRAWLENQGRAGAYVRLSCPPDRAAAFFKDLRALGFAGVNVTVPHKQTAYRAADRLTPLAAQTGAVNLLTVASDGALVGDNTDCTGFLAGLRAAGFDGTGPCLVIGAGGAARAVVVSLLQIGAGPVLISARKNDQAAQLAKDLASIAPEQQPPAAVAWQERHAALVNAKLLVNATSAGTIGGPALDLDLSGSHPDLLVYDLVYKPLETPLLAQALTLGLACGDGLTMLIEQARPSYQAHYGGEPPHDFDMRAFILARLQSQS